MKKKTRTRSLFYDYVSDIFFPARCPACGKVTDYKSLFCKDCAGSLEYIGESAWREAFLESLQGNGGGIDHVDSLFWYKGKAENCVLTLKSQKIRRFCDFTAERLCLKLESDGICGGGLDLITPVPLSRRKLRKRGYNQAELLAQSLSDVLGIPAVSGLLGRKNTFYSQHQLDAEDRKAMSEKAYYCKGGADCLSGKTVLLCDDIITTGSTVSVCAGLLRNMGAEKVFAVSVCKTGV